MRKETIYTQEELKTFMFRDINTAHNFSREVIEGMKIGENESLYVDIFADIDIEGAECWYVAFYIIQYYNLNALLELST